MHERITYNERVKLIGLKTLVEENDKERVKLEKAIASVIDEPVSEYGFYDKSSELMFSDRNVDNWLQWLEIKVTSDE